MKIISSIFGVAVLALVLCFALPNRQDVSVALWPLPGTLQVPLYLTGLAPLAFGLIFGGLWGWLSGVPHRLRARGLKKELHALNEKIDDLQKSVAARPPPLARKKHFWERKP